MLDGENTLLLGVLLLAAPSPAVHCDYKLLRGLEAAPTSAALRPAPPPPPPSGSEVLPYISPVICVCKLLRHPLRRPPPSYSHLSSTSFVVEVLAWWLICLRTLRALFDWII